MKIFLKIITKFVFLAVFFHFYSYAYEEEYKIMEENLPLFEKCYHDVLIKHSDYNVRIDMEFEIIKNGLVGHAITKLRSNNKLNTPPDQIKGIENCFVSTVKKIQFPKLSGFETKRIKYNFILENVGETYESCDHTKDTFKCVKYTSVSDNGSIVLSIHGIPHVFGKDIEVRLSGTLLPLAKSSDRCERNHFKKFKGEVHKALIGASRIDIQGAKRGESFNLMADIIFDGKSLTDFLVAKNIIIKSGRRKQKAINWCELSK